MTDVSELQERTDALLAVLDRLSHLLGPMTGVSNDMRKGTSYLEMLQNDSENKDAINGAVSTSHNLHDKIKAIRKELMDVPYPYSHSEEGISIGKYMLESIPLRDNIIEVYQAGEGMLDRFYVLYYRTLGKLASIAESIESAFGMEPFPEPPDEEDE